MAHSHALRVLDGYRTQSPDTSLAAERVLIEAWRRMSLAEKARRVSEMTLAESYVPETALRDVLRACHVA